MAQTNKAHEERLRRQSLSNARQLASSGFVDHAVRHFVEGGAHLEAAQLLDSHDRTWEAIHVLFAVVTLDPQKLAQASPEVREAAVYAAALLARSGDEIKSSRIIDGLSGLAPAESVVYRRVLAPRAGRGSSTRADGARAILTSGARPKVTGIDDLPTPPRGTKWPVEEGNGADTVRPPATEAYPPAPASGNRLALPEPSTRDYVRLDKAEPRASGRERLRSTIPPARQDGIRGLRKPSAPELLIEHVGAPRSSEIPNGAGSSPNAQEILERNLKHLLAAGRKDGAAQVAFAAGRYEQAVEWFAEAGMHHGVGACLRALGRHEEAIAHLTLTSAGGPNYREACREIAKAGMALGKLDHAALAYAMHYVESGPRSDREITTFLDFAELLKQADYDDDARRCVASVLRLSPDHDGAQLLQLAWGPPPRRRR